MRKGVEWRLGGGCDLRERKGGMEEVEVESGCDGG